MRVITGCAKSGKSTLNALPSDILTSALGDFTFNPLQYSKKDRYTGLLYRNLSMQRFNTDTTY